MKFGVFLLSFSCCFYLVCTANPKCEDSNKTKIIDLSDDCLLIILEQLELFDLFVVAQTNDYLFYLVRDVLRRRYFVGDSTRIVDISGSLNVRGRKSVSVTQSHIFIENAEIAISILPVIGHLIQRLSVNFHYITSGERIRIEQAIVNSCSDALKQIDFQGFDSDTLSAITKPLTSVEKITIKGKFRSSKVKALKLNEIFFGLRHLSLSLIDVYDPTLFNIQFPKLERFEIALFRMHSKQSSQNFTRNLKSAVNNLLKKNPTIKSVNFEHCISMDFVKMASDYLPNLEEIKVDSIALNGYNKGPMHFPNVKKVDFKWTHYNMTGLISFGQVEDMNLSCYIDECIDFLKENQNVTKLYFFSKLLNEQDILQIGDILPNIVELELVSYVNIGADPFVQLTQRSTQLQIITLDFVASRDLFNTLSEQVSGNWTVNEVGKKIAWKKCRKMKILKYWLKQIS